MNNDAQADATAAGNAAEAVPKLAPRYNKNVVNCSVVSVAATAAEVLSLIDNCFAPVISVAVAAQRDAAAPSLSIDVDVRWDAATLESAVVKLLTERGVLSGTYPPPATHASTDAWVPMDLALKQWRSGAKAGAPADEVAEHRTAAQHLWRASYPPGSVALWLVDSELLESEGAVALQMHIKHLLRPANRLHTARVSSGDIVLAVVNKD